MPVICTPTFVDAAIDAMVLFDRHFKLNLWPVDSTDDRRHDIRVMAAHSDLRGLSTELLDANSVVVGEFCIRFDRTDLLLPLDEDHWPLLDCVARGRFLVQRYGNESPYRDLLRLRWGPAATLPREEGDSCGSFYLGQSQRHRLIVTQSGPRFSFGDFTDEGAGRPHVFLLPEHADPVLLPFHLGQRLNAAVVLTRKGLQGRAIRSD